MTGQDNILHVLTTIHPGRAYDSMLIAASWTIGCCITGDNIDYWLRRFWRSRIVARFWSQVHAWFWPFSL